MRKKYFLYIKTKKANHAGSKAVLDTEYVLRKEGYKPIKSFSCTLSVGVIRRLVKLVQLIHMYLVLPRGAVLVVQHPLYMSNKYLYSLEKLKKRKGIKLVFIIHDIESIRNLFSNKEKYREQDSVMFRIADAVIAHNNAMIDAIHKEYACPKEKMVSLEIFDYILQEPESLISGNSYGSDLPAMVVGNLSVEKAGYLYVKESKSIVSRLSLYGPGILLDKLGGATYRGVFSPEEIVGHLHGSFGLVWDGDRSDTCSGSIGDYLRINNPHKVSMYLAAGYPVLIWDKAALAAFIEEQGVGIPISSLADIDIVLAGITAEEYEEYRAHVRKLQPRLHSGYYMKKALGHAMEIL